ncbi:glycosyltransferase family 2 protein [Candidatus Micrarchaeota archaeon]|nr:glycosyltransferase family 2 protein [Candidatus Micrarchaeota archaeon]MBI5177614.1 glycosyltransferase family 2 protein [Candidatus Micrarchaeota archaeon]
MAAKLPFISVVVVTFNRKGMLAQLLEALGRQDYPKERMERIVVDGGSTDGTPEFVRRKFPGWRVIHTADNIGHGGSINLGNAIARGGVVINFDDDAEPVGRDYLRRMAGKFSDTRVNFVAPKIINHFTKQIFWDGPTHAREPLANGSYDCAMFNGASYGIRKSVFDAAGGYDPEFFLHLEEQQYALKLRDAGFPLSYFPDIEVSHKMPAQIRFRGSRNRNAIRNTVQWCCKYLPWEYVLLTLFGVGSFFLQVAKGNADRGSVLGALEGIAQIPHYLRARGKTLSGKTVRYYFETKKTYTNGF